MTNLIPQPMTSDELADVLADMAERVRAGDSYEGNIAYMMPVDDEPMTPPAEGVDMYVTGVYRVGNLQGQGGVRMIGTVPGMAAPS